MGSNVQPSRTGKYDQFGWHETIQPKEGKSAEDTFIFCMAIPLFIVICVLVSLFLSTMH